nr:hypothetical protein [Vibrio splendidus]MCC4882949.1 hypothetical protein [Vibrio splendidus]
MATYIAVDAGYDIHPVSGIQGVADFMNKLDLRLSNGARPNKKSVMADMKSNSCVRAYSYSEDELKEALECGSVRGKDWEYRIVKL